METMCHKCGQLNKVAGWTGPKQDPVMPEPPKSIKCWNCRVDITPKSEVRTPEKV